MKELGPQIPGPAHVEVWCKGVKIYECGVQKNSTFMVLHSGENDQTVYVNGKMDYHWIPK